MPTIEYQSRKPLIKYLPQKRWVLALFQLILLPIGLILASVAWVGDRCERAIYRIYGY